MNLPRSGSSERWLERVRTEWRSKVPSYISLGVWTTESSSEGNPFMSLYRRLSIDFNDLTYRSLSSTGKGLVAQFEIRKRTFAAQFILLLYYVLVTKDVVQPSPGISFLVKGMYYDMWCRNHWMVLGHRWLQFKTLPATLD